jgi:type VI secretion system protein ImpK
MNIEETNIAPGSGAPATIGSPLRPGRETLARIYQEILTVITRLRGNRQAVMDARAFRSSMKAAIAAAEIEATRQGYTADDARLATFAVVAFLDESVENANDLSSTDWSRQSLQAELFGERAAGEIFFQCVDKLMARGDAPQDADVLEVFALCLLLGFQGRYGAQGTEGIRPVVNQITAKVQRIRGPRALAPDWEPRLEAVLQPRHDPWVRALSLGALGVTVLAILSFVGFKFALLSGASGLHAIIGLLAPR